MELVPAERADEVSLPVLVSLRCIFLGHMLVMLNKQRMFSRSLLYMFRRWEQL